MSRRNSSSAGDSVNHSPKKHATLSTVHRILKSFERSFKQKHGRKPNKNEIKRDSRIYRCYQYYWSGKQNELSSASDASTEQINNPTQHSKLADSPLCSPVPIQNSNVNSSLIVTVSDKKHLTNHVKRSTYFLRHRQSRVMEQAKRLSGEYKQLDDKAKKNLDENNNDISSTSISGEDLSSESNESSLLDPMEFDFDDFNDNDFPMDSLKGSIDSLIFELDNVSKSRVPEISTSPFGLAYEGLFSLTKYSNKRTNSCKTTTNKNLKFFKS